MNPLYQDAYELSMFSSSSKNPFYWNGWFDEMDKWVQLPSGGRVKRVDFDNIYRRQRGMRFYINCKLRDFLKN
jgi:hypothetical protein